MNQIIEPGGKVRVAGPSIDCIQVSGREQAVFAALLEAAWPGIKKRLQDELLGIIASAAGETTDGGDRDCCPGDSCVDSVRGGEGGGGAAGKVSERPGGEEQ